MRKAELLVEGQSRPASRGRRFQLDHPITGKPVTSAAAATVKDAQFAALVAAAAFPDWAATAPGSRRDLLLKAAQRLGDAADDIVAAMLDEVGATADWARFNLKLATEILVEAAGLTTLPCGEIIPSDRPGTTAMSVRRPVGPVLSIAPWNAPVILGVRSIATALACGNTVVFKSSEKSPHTHYLMVQAIVGAGPDQGGLPAGILNLVSCDSGSAEKVVGALIDHEAIRRVNFTGSTRVGRIIAERAARHLKPVLLELGGSAPLIVLEDADIDAAVSAAVFGAYMNQGQICMSTERIIVVDAIADRFAEAFAERTRALRSGNPAQSNAPLGPMIGKDAANRIRKLVDNALSRGAIQIAGGEGRGAILDPVALDFVTPEMRVWNEECFGPIASIIRVANEEEAVRVANATEYGLSAAVFSRDQARALALAARIDSGICHINGPTVHDEAQMPFGGVKASGMGRFGGVQAVSQFTETRWITMQNGPLSYPI